MRHELYGQGGQRMISWDQLEQFAKIVGSIGVIVAATAAAWKKGIKPFWNFASNVSNIFEGLDAIKYQLVPNGGGSIRDAIDRIEARQIIHEQRYKMLYMDSPFAIFETDAEGNSIHVNRTYCRWTGRSAEELQGNGWLNILAPESRSAVFKEWETAMEQSREFSMEYSIIAIAGSRIAVRCNAFPMFDSKQRLCGWMGIICKI